VATVSNRQWTKWWVNHWVNIFEQVTFNIRHYKDVIEQPVWQWRRILIGLIKLWWNKRSVWDVTYPNYSNANERKAALSRISQQIQIDGVATCKSIKLKTVVIHASADIFDVTSHTEWQLWPRPDPKIIACTATEGKLSEMFCAVVCTIVVHNDSNTHEMSVGFSLGLVFVRLFRFSILCVFFWFSLDYFVFVLFAFVVLDLVSSVLRQLGDWLGRTSPKWPYLCRVGVKS